MEIIDTAMLPRQPVSHNPRIEKQVVLRSGRVPHVTQFASARLEPGQIAGAHAHADMYEVFLVQAGEGILRINGTDHPLRPGICVVVEPGEVHELMGAERGCMDILYFGIAV